MTSNPKVTFGAGSVTVPAGTINPGQSSYFEFVFRARNIGVSGDGTAMSNTATIFGEEINPLSATSTAVYKEKRVSRELLVDISWNGIETKNSSCSVGDEIELSFDISGGSAPYQIKIDWGGWGEVICEY